MQGELHIRAAVPDDLVLLADLARVTFVQAFGSEIDSSELDQHLRENMSDDAFAEMMKKDRFLVADGQDCLIGFVQVGRVNAEYADHLDSLDNQAGEIKRLYVLADYQQRGLGSTLLEQGLRQIALASDTYVTTWETNHGALNLYRRFGFLVVGQMPEYGSDGELNGYEYIMKRPA